MPVLLYYFFHISILYKFVLYQYLANMNVFVLVILCEASVKLCCFLYSQMKAYMPVNPFSFNYGFFADRNSVPFVPE